MGKTMVARCYVEFDTDPAVSDRDFVQMLEWDDRNTIDGYRIDGYRRNSERYLEISYSVRIKNWVPGHHMESEAGGCCADLMTKYLTARGVWFRLEHWEVSEMVYYTQDYLKMWLNDIDQEMGDFNDEIWVTNMRELLQGEIAFGLDHMKTLLDDPRYCLDKVIPGAILMLKALDELNEAAEEAKAQATEQPVEEPRRMTIPEFNADYALWAGNCSVEGDNDVSPWRYIQEFCEHSWTPIQEDIRAFLRQFYTQETTEELLGELE